MKSRKVLITPNSDTHNIYRVIMVSEDCSPGTPEYGYLQFEMLQQLLMNRDLAICGPNHFQTLKFYHNGERWVLELESIVPRPI